MCAGEEFRACFISTTEPTWKDGSSRNPTKSICDPFVFNTALTRAQSLVVAVGNPFLLLKMERHMVAKHGKAGKGWSTYIRECLKRNVLSVSPLLKTNATQIKHYINKLKQLTGLSPTSDPSLSSKQVIYSPTLRQQPKVSYEPVSIRPTSAYVPPVRSAQSTYVPPVHSAQSTYVPPVRSAQSYEEYNSDFWGVQSKEDILYYGE